MSETQVVEVVRTAHLVAHDTVVDCLGEMTFEEWKELGRKLKGAERYVQWYLGWWWNNGHKKWSRDAEAFAEKLGYARHTLEDYGSVCVRVNLSVRTEGLSFNHHQLVAPCEPPEQRHWLRADAEKRQRDAGKRGKEGGRGKKKTLPQFVAEGNLDRHSRETCSLRAKAARLGEEAIGYAHEVKIDALTLLGDMLRRTERAKGGQPYQKSTSTTKEPVDLPTLAHLNLTKKESATAQALSDVAKKQPESHAAVREDAEKRQREHGGTAPGRKRTPTEQIPEVKSRSERETRAVRAKIAGTNPKYIDLADELVATQPDVAEQVEFCPGLIMWL